MADGGERVGGAVEAVRLAVPCEVNSVFGLPLVVVPGAPRLRGEDPIRAVSEEWILVTRGSVERGTEFWLWSPLTGERRWLWTTEPGKSDLVGDVEGEWVVFTRMGMWLPLVEWRLYVRNVETGEVRVLAEGDRTLGDVGGLPVGVPLGFAPLGTMAGGRVAWVEWYRGEGGSVRKRLRVYELGSGGVRTVVEVADPYVEDVRWPSLGGRRLAWVHDRKEWADSEVVVVDLSSGEERRFVPGGTPTSGELSGDGQFYVWDVGFRAKFSLNLDGGDVVRFANYEGQYVRVVEQDAYWTTDGAGQHRAGVYHVERRQTRFAVATEVVPLGHGWFALKEGDGAFAIVQWRWEGSSRPGFTGIAVEPATVPASRGREGVEKESAVPNWTVRVAPGAAPSRSTCGG